VNNIDQETLKDLVKYNPETGVFIWRHRNKKHIDCPRVLKAWNTKSAGHEAGRIDQKGYMRIMVGGHATRAHRLAFLYMTGKYPSGQVDHINGAKDDNRWGNLRDVRPIENQRNMKIRTDNTSGVMGVRWHAECRQWVAYITIGGRQQYLGIFADWFDAACARKSAEARHGFHQNHGRRA